MLIDLDKADKAIMKVLEDRPTHPSALARLTRLPRTTITYRLLRLHEHKFIDSKKEGRKTVWHINFKNPTQKSSFQVYSGENFKDAYLPCLTLPHKSVILWIQGVSAARNEIKHLPRSLVFKVHQVFKRKDIVFKSISNIKALDIFKEIDDKYLKSHIGRSGGLKLFKNDLFLGAGEIAVCEKFILISNPAIQSAVVIKEPELIKTLYETLNLLFDSLEQIRGIDLNEYMKKVVERKA